MTPIPVSGKMLDGFGAKGLTMTGEKKAGNLTLSRIGFASITSLALSLAACSSLIDPNAPEPIRRFHEPQGGGEYLLYRPSGYDRNQSWPLIVACPSSFPDSPDRQMREWTQLAEQYGFLIAVPRVEFASKNWSGKPKDLALGLKKNESRILSTVQHVRAGQNVSEDRILIYGWKRGAASALYSGLRNPEVFRAISVTRPDLFEDRLPGEWIGVDRHQSVQVHYDMDDFITGRHGQAVAKWLRSNGVAVAVRTLGEAGKSDTADAVLFFQDVIRRVPWVHIRAFTPDANRPLEVHFKTKSSLSPKAFRWYFGDGDESVVAQPVHVFARPGTYQVRLELPGPDGRMITRSARVTVPGPQLRPGG